jgi:hypothetical protein
MRYYGANTTRKKVIMRRVLVITSAAALGGCASSTGVLPAGPETYTLSERFAPVRGGSDEAQRVALTKANEYCAQQGRTFVPAMMSQEGNLTNPDGPPTGYTVTFKCLQPNDPAIAKYQIQQAPNVIVEQRNR